MRLNLSVDTEQQQQDMASPLRLVRPFIFTFKLQEKTELLEMQHDIFSRNQFRQVFEALCELTALP